MRRNRDNGWLYEICYRRGYGKGYIEGYEACRKDAIYIMKKGFYAGLAILAFLMVLMTPSYDATWGDIIMWIFHEAFWVLVLIAIALAYEYAK